MLFKRILIVALAAIALLSAGCGGQQAGEPGGTTNDITIKMTEMEFDPSTITVNAGTAVKITVKNEGDVRHSLTIEGFEDQVHLVADAGKSDSTTFTPATPGTYRIICSEIGHEDAGMTGEMVVK